jgi:hypothetical protein
MCRRRHLRRQAHALAELVDHQQRGDVADALLDRRQPDQLALELVEHGFDLARWPADRRRSTGGGHGGSGLCAQ